MPQGRKRIGPLNTIRAVRVEMGRVYRQMRNHDIPLDEGRGLVWVLTHLVSAIRDNDLEDRVKVLEERK